MIQYLKYYNTYTPVHTYPLYIIGKVTEIFSPDLQPIRMFEGDYGDLMTMDRDGRLVYVKDAMGGFTTDVGQ